MLSQIDYICQDFMWPRHSELPALGLAAMSGLYSLWPGGTLVKTMISFQFSFRSNAWFLLTRSSQLFLPAPSHCSPIFATLTCPSLKLRESRSLLLMITESLIQWSLVATELSLCPTSSLTLITHWSQSLLTTTNCPQLTRKIFRGCSFFLWMTISLQRLGSLRVYQIFQTCSI